MKKKTKPTRQVKQYVPAFLRLKPRRDGQRRASGEAVLAYMRDQQRNGSQRLAAWYRKSAAAPAGDATGTAGEAGL